MCVLHGVVGWNGGDGDETDNTDMNLCYYT